jgi:hypothetical protein
MNPNSPRIKIQLWQGFPPVNPPSTQAAQQRVACVVWERDWKHATIPVYLLFSEISRGQLEVPAAYVNHDWMHLDTEAWWQAIKDHY